MMILSQYHIFELDTINIYSVGSCIRVNLLTTLRLLWPILTILIYVIVVLVKAHSLVNINIKCTTSLHNGWTPKSTAFSEKPWVGYTFSNFFKLVMRWWQLGIYGIKLKKSAAIRESHCRPMWNENYGFSVQHIEICIFTSRKTKIFVFLIKGFLKKKYLYGIIDHFCLVFNTSEKINLFEFSMTDVSKDGNLYRKYTYMFQT